MKTSRQGSWSANIKKGLAEKGISSRSIIAFLLFGMIVLVFVLSDMSGRSAGGGGLVGSAAEVNGQIISLKDFQEEENRLSQYYGQLFGGQFDMGAQRAMLRGEVMNTLVNKAVTSQAAEKEGIYATDAEIRHTITQELPYFKRDGVFQTDAYRSILSANRLTPGEFEAKLRQDIVGQRSRQLFEAAMGATELQKMAEVALKSTKMNIEYVTLNPQEYAKNHPVSVDEINKRLAEPDFKKKVEDNFNANKANYETKEQVKASHILIRSGEDEASVQKAQEKANAILKRLEKEDFAKVAGQVSEDPGSKSKNGDLGYFSRGSMVPEFEEAAFSLPVGKVSGLVKTSYGFHIIKVADKKTGTAASLEAAKMEIARQLIQSEQFSKFNQTVEAALAGSKPEEAIALLNQQKLTWKETGKFDLASESIPGINSTQALKMALELTKDQPVAKKLVREGETQYLLRLKDISTTAPVALTPADQDMLTRQKSAEAFRLWVDSYKKESDIETNQALLTQ